MAKVWKFLRKTSMKEFLSCEVTNLQCSDCNFAIKILIAINFAIAVTLLITDTFWNMYRKLAILKNNILRKKSMVDELLNKVATL